MSDASPRSACEAIQAATGVTAPAAARALEYLRRVGWHLLADKEVCFLRGECAARLEFALK